MRLVPTNPAAFGARRYPIVRGEHGTTHYGPWRIHHDPPPIPIRSDDWHFVHENYDASYEGEEDGWVSNGLGGSCASFADALNECDALEDEFAPASVDTHPTGGDAIAAPLVSGAVPPVEAGDAQNPPKG